LIGTQKATYHMTLFNDHSKFAGAPSVHLLMQY
jgi:hypothetical protein